MLAAAAEYELELRAERQAEGIAAARRGQAEGPMLPGKKCGTQAGADTVDMDIRLYIMHIIGAATGQRALASLLVSRDSDHVV